MKPLRHIRSMIMVLCGLILTTGQGYGNTDPPSNPEKKWTIAYYEGGAYTDYTDSMGAVISGLMSLGWIETATLPSLEGNVSKPYWDWLCKNAQSDYLNFRPTNAFSADWRDEDRKIDRASLLQRLQSGTIDLVIAMGTWAGQDLANTNHRVPTTVVSTSDPIKAGIIKNAKDSGLDHVTARVDPNRYLRQIRMFHRLVQFKKLGVAYEDTPDGRLYSALDDVKTVCDERKIDMVLCAFNDSLDDRKKSAQQCMDCMKALATQSDAVYLTALLAVEENIEAITELFRKTKTPSFSLVGSKYVKKGVLMSVSSDEGYKAQGLYDASKIARILNGDRPRDLKQVFPDPLDIAINIKTARSIEFDVPLSILRIAHEIYEQNPQ